MRSKYSKKFDNILTKQEDLVLLSFYYSFDAFLTLFNLDFSLSQEVKRLGSLDLENLLKRIKRMALSLYLFIKKAKKNAICYSHNNKFG